jgi:hypothetical protein
MARATVVGQVVTLTLLLVVGAAGDEMHGDPAAADLVDGGERLGRKVG